MFSTLHSKAELDIKECNLKMSAADFPFMAIKQKQSYTVYCTLIQLYPLPLTSLHRIYPQTLFSHNNKATFQKFKALSLRKCELKRISNIKF